MQLGVQNLRDILSLASLLRRFAEHHIEDASHELFVSTAVALEARAHSLADAPDCAPLDREMLYAPVNRLI